MLSAQLLLVLLPSGLFTSHSLFFLLFFLLVVVMVAVVVTVVIAHAEYTDTYCLLFHQGSTIQSHGAQLAEFGLQNMVSLSFCQIFLLWVLRSMKSVLLPQYSAQRDAQRYCCQRTSH